MDVDDFLSPLSIDDQRLSKLAIDFSHTYRHLALHSTEQFLATPVNVLPKGSEEGRFLAIDVGGSNLRVGFVHLLGAQSGRGGELRRKYERSWSIEDHFKMDNAEEFFSWIGSCIALVVADYAAGEDESNAADSVLPLGITFSFPMIQGSISEATLMPMGKGFAITSELNLGKMLLKGYSDHIRAESILGAKRAHGQSVPNRLPDLEITAITNDTVATLACLAYSAHALPSSRVAMGLIVGTGTNSSIVMKLDDLHEDKRRSIVLPAKASLAESQIVVNTEWTIKGAASPLHRAGLVTKWDTELDQNCEAPGFQPFEYMTAGRYLGELARIILYDYLVNVEGVEAEQLPNAIRQRNSISTLFLSSVVAQSASPAELMSRLRIELPPNPADWQWSETSASVLLRASKALQLRSARMIGAATVGLLASAGELQWSEPVARKGLSEAKDPCEELIVAYAGGVISSYPNFLDTIQAVINDLVSQLTLVKKVNRVVLKDANNGGLLGAGVLAGTVWNLP